MPRKSRVKKSPAIVESKAEMPKQKPKKQPSQYAKHVRNTYHTPECLAKPVRERLGHCAEIWRGMSDEEKAAVK